MAQIFGPKRRYALALAVILALGVGTCWAFVSELMWSMIEPWVVPPSIYENVVFTTDGQPLIHQRISSNFDGDTYRTLKGEPITDFSKVGRDWSPFFASPDRKYDRVTNWQSRLLGFSSEELPPVYWYLIHDGYPQGHAYFVGFNSQSKQSVGYLGLAGFRTDMPPMDEQFVLSIKGGVSGGVSNQGEKPYPPGVVSSEYPRWMIKLVSQGQLWSADLNQRSLQPVVMSDEVLAFEMGQEPRLENSFAGNVIRFLVRHPDRLKAFNLEGEEMRTLVIPDILRRTGFSLTHWWTDEPIYSVSDWISGRTELYWADAAGNVKRQEMLHLTPGNTKNLKREVWVAAANFPAPLSQVAWLFAKPWEHVLNGEDPDYGSALTRVWNAARPVLLVICLLSLSLSVWCYRRHRRYSERGALLWAGFVFLLGMPGLIGYLLYRPWPVTEHCRKCGQASPRDRGDCLSCHAEFPLPALKGIEVFA